ncbi:phage baseplate assembly protein W [Bradyrhizobium sp. AZCC 1610]|uniref:hypothetical protein n=1 Tax=Bradyrhizobium sp. AZCC 1610 TaxID=3117020 RepID=UPI002FF12AE5
MNQRPHRWQKVSLIEDDFDQVESVGEVLSTSRGERRAPSRYGGEYRRSNRYTEDGYGELDFA